MIERAAERARRALTEGRMGIDETTDLAGVDPYALADQVTDGPLNEAG